MARPATINVPTTLIGSISRPADLIELVARCDLEDPNLSPFYEDAIHNTVKHTEAEVHE